MNKQAAANLSEVISGLLCPIPTANKMSQDSTYHNAARRHRSQSEQRRLLFLSNRSHRTTVRTFFKLPAAGVLFILSANFSRLLVKKTIKQAVLMGTTTFSKEKNRQGCLRTQGQSPDPNNAWCAKKDRRHPIISGWFRRSFLSDPRKALYAASISSTNNFCLFVTFQNKKSPD